MIRPLTCALLIALASATGVAAQDQAVTALHCSIFDEIVGAEARQGGEYITPAYQRSVEAFLTPARDCTGPRDLQVRTGVDAFRFFGGRTRVAFRLISERAWARSRGEDVASWPRDDYGLRLINRWDRVITRTDDAMNPSGGQPR